MKSIISISLIGHFFQNDPGRDLSWHNGIIDMKAPITLNQNASAGLNAHQAPWQRIILLTVLGYEGAGGLLGGALLTAAPDGRLMDMPVSIMHGTFRDFLIPGIILSGLGILNVFAFYSVFRRLASDWLIGGLALGGFIIWFVVEIAILQELHWLHLMWGLPVLIGWLALTPLIALRNATPMTAKILLGCGILSSAWYIAINIYVPLQYEGYDLLSLSVSELSAIGAPTRQLWVLLMILYPLAFGAFGWGVIQSAKSNRPLRIVGWLIVAYCAFNLYWPPMHQRGIQPSLTDTLHIAWAMITVLTMWVMMGFGAAAFGIRFRIYTILSIALHIIFGLLTGLDAPNIPTNGPTPLLGVWERINIAIFLIWVVVLALAILRKQRHPSQPAARSTELLTDKIDNEYANQQSVALEEQNAS
jgi:hypothetical protein